jgi:serine/threonine-protein kinase HipA
LADTSRAEDLDFDTLADAVDAHGLPGVQAKASASMLTTPLALAHRRFLLKLDPPRHANLVINEAAHLTGAKALKIPVARHSVVTDRYGLRGLPVERFDRPTGGGPPRLALEDAAQVMNLPPASNYAVSSEEAVLAFAGLCKAQASGHPWPAEQSAHIPGVKSWQSETPPSGLWPMKTGFLWCTPRDLNPEPID